MLSCATYEIAENSIKPTSAKKMLVLCNIRFLFIFSIIIFLHRYKFNLVLFAYQIVNTETAKG